ncbi:LuxR C-terminal-related transcriptional regulator [Nocardioides caeni]|nr:LuxR C-terminal-related transcriptional regulator [Nocardioides caeni]
MPWPILDRPDVEDRLDRSLRAAPPRAVLLRGTSGVGKTTLARRLGERWSRQGRATTVLPIIGLAELQDAPLAPFVPLLRPLGLRYQEPAGLTARDLIASIGTRARQVLVVVDDAPLLDSTSAAVVHQLVRAFGVAAVMTARTEHGLHGPLERLAVEDALETIDLDGLTRIDVDDLLRRRLGATVRPDDVTRLHEQTGGNPLHLRELVDFAERRGLLRRVGAGVEIDQVALPLDLHTSIADRLSDLPPDALAVLRIVALGASTPRSVLLPTAEEQRLALDLVARNLVELRGDILRVAHPTFAEAVTAGLDTARREAVVDTVAGRLEASGDDGLRFTAVRLRCDTAAGAGRADLAWAVRHAFSMGAHLVAHELGGRLRSADGQAPPFGTAVDEASALSFLGRHDEAEAAFTRAEATATTSADLALLASRWGSHRAYRRFDVAAALVLAARLAPRLDASDRALLEPEIRTWRILNGEAPGGAGDPLPAGEGAAPEVAVRGAISAVMLDSMSGRLGGEAADVLARIEREQGILDPFAAAMVHIQQYFLLLSQGRGEEAARVCEEQRVTCTPDAVGMWSLTLGIHRMYGGRLADALALAELAVAQLRWRDPLGFLGFAVALQANVAAQLGRDGVARELLATLVPSQVADPKTALQRSEALAWLTARSGDPAAAARLVVETARAAAEAGHDLVAAISLSVCLRVGQARQAAGLLVEIHGRVGTGLGLYDDLTALAGALDTAAPDPVRAVAAQLARAGMEATAIDALRLAEQMPDARARPEVLRRLQRSRRDLEQHSDVRPWHVDDTDVLTDREWEIVDLVCQRLASREIAERLVLSVRTVDNHLAKVYRKLGVSGRAELRRLLDES